MSWSTGTIWPPLQPLLLAGTYALFGTHVLAAQVLQRRDEREQVRLDAAPLGVK